jgi:predicted AAA+ superfamily ATPase
LQFVEGTHPTENLKRLVKDVDERLAGVQGVTPFYKLETGFGGRKTHGLTACVHVARHGHELSDRLSAYEIRRYPDPESVRVGTFVGESSSLLDGVELTVDGQTVRTLTPWG